MLPSFATSPASVFSSGLALVAMGEETALTSCLPASRQSLANTTDAVDFVGDRPSVSAFSAPAFKGAPGADISGADILWRHYQSGQVLGWFLDQIQVQQSHWIGEIVADPNWAIEGTGDFNNDGQADILWRHQGVGQVVVWYLNNGLLERGEQIGDWVPDTHWKIAGVGDFNLDGKDDILWHHGISGQVVTWHMNGTGKVQTSQLLGETVPDRRWEIAGVGDFNGDGIDDVLWRHQTGSGQNVAWHLDGQGRIATSSLVGQVVSDLDWHIKGAGDFDGDGKTDILLRHYASGDNLVWLMNGSTVTSAQRVGPTVPDLQWQPVVSRRALVVPGSQANQQEQEPISQPTLFQEPEPLPKPKGSFSIEIDYSFDTQGWFTPPRRASLEAAARVWEAIIEDDFQEVPAGTPTPYVFNPETGDYLSTGGTNIYLTTRPIDDLRIFVGARNLGSSKLGMGGPSGYYTNESRYVGSDFEPWLGSISFNSAANWFFDETPETLEPELQGKNDFLSTAIHEIGHVLGFNAGIAAFAGQLTAANNFGGAQARAHNGGNEIPLSGSHIRDRYEFNGSGETVMDPASFAGTRQLPTLLDIAIFADIGYQVNFSKAWRNTSENRPSGVSGDTGLSRVAAIAEGSTPTTSPEAASPEVASPETASPEGPDGSLADSSHDRLVPACCSCGGCQTAPLALAWVGETDLAQWLGV